MQFPWDDWIPGALNKAQVEVLCKSGHVTGVDPSGKAIDLSSIDLSLSDTAFEMIEGSVKPSGTSDYEHLLLGAKLAREFKPSADGVYHLRAKSTYVFSCASGSPT